MGPKKNKQSHVHGKAQPGGIQAVKQKNGDGNDKVSKVAPVEQQQPENHPSSCPTHNDKGTGIKTKGKSYSRRNLQSNWDRYDEEPEAMHGNSHPGESVKETQTFQELLAKAGASTNRFQFKDERQWNEDDANTSLVLDLDKLASALYSPEVTQKDRLLLGGKAERSCDLQDPTARSQKASLNFSKTLSNQQQFVWDYGNLKLGKQAARIEDPLPSWAPSGVAAVTSPNESSIAESASDLDDIDELLALSEQHKVAQENKSVPLHLQKDVPVMPEPSRGKTPVLRGLGSEARSHDLPSPEAPSVAGTKDYMKPQVTNDGQDLEDWLDEILG